MTPCKTKMVVSVDQKLQFSSEISKVDEEHGLVIGYAIVCKEDGEPYYDLQNEHIPEEVMLKASLAFMEDERTAVYMHEKDANGEKVKAGTVVFAFPMTTDVSKALEIVVKRTGLIISMRPEPLMLEKFKSGELKGFSIGGRWLEREILTDAA